MIANTAEEPEKKKEADVGDVSRHVMIVTKTETDTVTVAGVRKYVNIAKIQQVRWQKKYASDVISHLNITQIPMTTGAAGQESTATYAGYSSIETSQDSIKER